MAARKKQRVKVVRDDDLTPLEIHAIQLNEYYKALRKAGFSVDHTLYLLTGQGSHPDWFELPNKHQETIGTIPYDDEDEDD